jgi:hypothetical protein
MRAHAGCWGSRAPVVAAAELPCVPTPAVGAPARARSSSGGAPVRAHAGRRPRSQGSPAAGMLGRI